MVQAQEKLGVQLTGLNLAELTEEEANKIYEQGREAVVFVLLKLAQKLAEQEQSPSTPSAMIAVYQKPAVRTNGKTPGQKDGHDGVRRASPVKIDQYQEHRLKSCPQCGGEVSKPARTRKRIIEDIPQVEPVVTEHTIHGSYCSRCEKIVEPVVADALPGATIGNNLVALTAWLHYGLGNTLSQIVSVLNYHLQFKISEGGLIGMWNRLHEILYVWYEQIAEEARKAGVLHADETGWRVSGITHWLWCFTTQTTSYYMIDKSRGKAALMKFFTEAFEGILITDFWAAYDRITAGLKQKCMVHLFREIEKVLVRNKSPAWLAFSKKLKRLLRDTLRLKKRDDVSEQQYASRRERFDVRLDEILQQQWEDADAQRIVKRLTKYREDLFTFLDHDDVPADNNHAEREIRPAVIIRKNSLCNRSQDGADMQAVLMSVYRTLKLRGINPIQTIAMALRIYVQTGKVPPLPTIPTSLG